MSDAHVQSAAQGRSMERVVGDLTGLIRRAEAQSLVHRPLLVALHGGTYTARYFDLPGCSLLERAAANGIDAIAINRPGYLDSPSLAPAEATVRGQARQLTAALKECWARHGQGTKGIVLVGHSIGGAIAASIGALAATDRQLPLIGIALSGMCMRTPPEHKPLWESLPDTPTVEMPAEVKVQMMFGPPGSFDPTMVETSRMADAPAPKAELVDIVSTWTGNARDTLGCIRVPVHYRQAERDPLWIMSQDEIDAFAAALSSSPRVDAAMVRNTGHCMDLHHVGAALHLQQLGFALQCAAEA